MNQLKFDRVFALVATAAVVTGAIAGFWLLGSPTQQRQIRADQQRLRDLHQIAQNLNQKAEQSQNRGKPVNLPASLSASERKSDPISGKLYDYQRIDNTRYKLCAEFATNSAEDRLQDPTTEQDFWQHPAGRHCFQLNVLEKPKPFQL